MICKDRTPVKYKCIFSSNTGQTRKGRFNMVACSFGITKNNSRCIFSSPSLPNPVPATVKVNSWF